MEEEIHGRNHILTRKKLHDKNLVKAIITNVIPEAADQINFCKFSQLNKRN